MVTTVVSGIKQSTIVSSDQTTIVKSVTVGRPVRRVIGSTASIDGLQDVNVTNKANGSVLVYNSSTSKWTATLDLENQNINGGSY
jgi:hypothetical protein